MKKKIALLLTMLLTAGSLFGCSIHVGGEIYPDLSSTITTGTFVTEEEVRLMGGDMLTDEDVEAFLADMEKQTMNGVDYYYTSETEELTQEDFTYSYGRLDSDCVVVYGGGVDVDELSGEEAEMMNGLTQLITSMHFSFKTPFEIKKTNAPISSEDTFTFDLYLDKPGQVYYALNDESLLEGTNLSIEGVKDGAYYNKDVKATVETSDGIIETLEARQNGVMIAFNGSENPYNVFQTLGDGTYKITASLFSGTEKTVSITIDTTKPKANVANNKRYKKGQKITFSDKGSGIKSAKLDGKTVKSGKKVTKNGKHKLVLTDKAGNKTTVNFSIK